MAGRYTRWGGPVFRGSQHLQPSHNGNLTHPGSLDKPLKIAARAKVTKHQAAYSNNTSTSFMPVVANTSGRFHCEPPRHLFLHFPLFQTHRETEKYLTLNES